MISLFVATLLIASNLLLRKKIKQEASFQNISFMKDNRRHFDAIVIGKPVKNSSSLPQNTLFYVNHNRSIFASYLFLIHFYSYLKEDGKGVIYLNNINTSDTNFVTIWDLKFLHPVVLNYQLGLRNLKMINRFPLIFIFHHFDVHNYLKEHHFSNTNDRIKTFCEERNLNYKFVNI